MREDGSSENISSGSPDLPSNPKIKINSPTVSMQGDWEIGRIAVSDSGELTTGAVGYKVFYGPFYD